MTPAIEISQLRKNFTSMRRPPVRALRGIDLVVPEGAAVGLLGPNGAGKSTTLWILLGMLRPTSGSARVLGKPAGETATYRRIGFLPENFAFHRYFSAQTLLRLYARLLAPSNSAPLMANADQLMGRFGLQEMSRQKLRKFSKGMLQKVGILQAVVHDPDLLVLDEPSANLDPSGRKLVRDIVEEMKRRGKTIVISSHILSEIEAVCDQVVILDQGELRGNFRVEELLQHRDQWVVDSAPLTAEQREALVARGLKVDDGGHYHRIHVGKPELWNLLEWLHAGGVELLGANPLRYSLEEAYLRLLSRKGESAS